MTNEDFYEAAIRHWLDGSILEEQGEYDNAVCMQGFAAECALKKLMDMLHVMNDVKKYNHFGEELFQDIKMILSVDPELTTLISPSCGLRLSAISRRRGKYFTEFFTPADIQQTCRSENFFDYWRARLRKDRVVSNIDILRRAELYT